MNNTYDLIIVGGGITGMTAAIYAARANLKTLVLEKMVCGGLVNSTHVVENFPSYPSINGMDLMEKVRDHVDALGVEVIEIVEIESLHLTGERKSVVTDEGDFSSSAIILATGRTPRKLPIETDFEQIHYCAICDGTAYKDKDVVVIGGGNSGVDESLYMLGLGVRSILVVEEFDRLLASESACRQLTSSPDVEVMTSTRIEAIHGNGRLESISLRKKDDDSRLTKAVDGIFVYIGQDPQTDLYVEQLELDKAGYIPVDSEMKTALPGVFAAGDVIQKKFRQITTAMGDGTIAALSAIEYLTTLR
ncbi:NAD(P)/FAD-dependent oxidoreductase [Desulfosediminicola flagellatus]|uniref:NAD(P)/FAD-dependent oxidoreductase n=1 Tax=Desulfosediminicola flagellatus TaxID=2569541 RepID=UPI0010ABEACD|nr:FAD-dependent oxidoreductase [Desulfosediminicola flagellatus]